MDISVVVPVFNEEAFLEKSLMSLLTQTYSINELVIVDDGSTDSSVQIAQKFANKYPHVTLLSAESSSFHAPGKKVIRAFERGYHALSLPWDVICKFDADIEFPPNYIATLIDAFSQHKSLGLFGGIVTIEKNGVWVVENIASPTHVRGPIKAYRKTCFNAIGGLRPVLGWDTLDELLAHYQGFTVKTDITLKVKHLRPTGNAYNRQNAKEKGLLFYQLGYGLVLGLLASVKWAIRERGNVFMVISGFLGGWFSKQEKLVVKSEAAFIRKFRWSQIFRRSVS